MKKFITKRTLIAKLNWEFYKTKNKKFEYIIKDPYKY